MAEMHLRRYFQPIEWLAQNHERHASSSLKVVQIKTFFAPFNSSLTLEQAMNAITKIVIE
jgi:hypothetical protein